MVTLEWTQRIIGTAVYCTDSFLLTAPALGDGNWRSGYWGRYRRSDGALQWQRYHRRGCSLFDVVGDVVIATTHKYSGIYAISARNGRMLWSRMGDRFEWLFRLFEWLPCDNEADTPLATKGTQLLTHGRLLLDIATGETLRRCRFEYEEKSPDDVSFGRKLLSVDGEAFETFKPPNRRFETVSERTVWNRIAHCLHNHGLVKCSTSLSHRFGGSLVVIAAEIWKPNRWRLRQPEQPQLPDSRDNDVPYYLVFMDSDASRIEYQLELGTYDRGHIAWIDDTTLAVACQTRRQWMWSSQRHLKVFRWTNRSPKRT